MGRPQQINSHKQPIARQAALRLILSLGLFVILVGLTSSVLYRTALAKASGERANDQASFYTARLFQLEREWERLTRDFRVRIEYTRILEAPQRAVNDLQAYMTVQGDDRRFQYLMIQDKQGNLLLASGKNLSLAAIPPGIGENGWYLDKSSGNLYRVFEDPIWLGKKGMGRMAMFFFLDNALLNQLSSPGITLTALYQGHPVASSLGEVDFDALPPQEKSGSSERRTVSWTGMTNGPTKLLIQAPVKALFSPAELVSAACVIPILDGLILWLVLGTWLMRNARRINALGGAVNEFSSRHSLTEDLRRTILRAKGNQLDEIHDVASELETMAEQLVRREHERELAESQLRLWAQVFHSSGEAIVICDHNNLILEVNQTFERLTGYSQEEAKGRNPNILSSGRDGPEFYREMWQKLLSTGHWHGEMWDRRKDGSIFPKWLNISIIRNDRGEITHYIGSFTDMSARKAEERHIHHLAHHDSLTGLPNRLMLNNFLERAIEEAKRDDGKIGILFLDMDHFKNINDSLGHDAGDKLLIEVARRLTEIIRGADTISRLGGDEFVVVSSGAGQMLDLVYLASRIVEKLSEPYLIDEVKLHSSPSIGISIFPTDGEDTQTLLKNADAAMYHAKAEGRGNFQFYAATMNQVAHERLVLENNLRTAVAQQQFELHYQPQIRLDTGRVIGVEALVRWRHPEQGLISPAKFIPMAEETGLIVALGEWVLRTACRQAVAWQQEGFPAMTMAVNISARQFRQEGLLETVQKALEESGLEPCWLELEITETAAMTSPDNTAQALMKLKEIGIQLAIDDFGTGHSSLSYLKLFPLDKLKIDQSFVRDIENGVSDAKIAAAIIVLAKKLGFKVIAEGVETAGQLQFLAENECDEVQGYYFARPQPAREVAEFLRTSFARQQT